MTHRTWPGWLALITLGCWLTGTTPAGATVALSTQTYTFTGQCQDCTGTGIGTLTVRDYTLGTDLQTGNVVSFSYDSNLLSYSFLGSDITGLAGGLPGAMPSNMGSLDMVFGSQPGTEFRTNVEFWCTGNACAADYGFRGSWDVASVPEPASMALLGGGLVALAGMRRRRA